MESKTKSNKTTKAKEKVQTADEKRLLSIATKKKKYKTDQNAIKAALANVDARTSKRVVFDDEESGYNDMNEVNPRKNDDASGKHNLFDDSDEGETEPEFNFEVKEQFQGKKGKKLLELQSKYKNDKRFTLDERFLGDEENELDSNNEGTQNTEKNGDVGNELPEEKQTEFAILEEVLGKKVHRKSEEVKKASTRSMLHYDPAKPEHVNLEVKNTDAKVSKKRKLKQSENAVQDEQEVEELPKVSKETFYEVKENLKDSLKESGSFSLLNMFGREEAPEKETQPEEIEHEVIKEKFIKDKNPFRYDSSDNEPDEEDKYEPQEVQECEEVEGFPIPQQRINLGPQKLWTEPFFFQEDDYRFQEGFDFVRRFDIEDTDFSTVRCNIKEIIKAKVKHVQKKNRPFKKKLGGRKNMLKMKKAMKI